MRISIVIPAHNEESSIAGSIRAALAQDYPDFEVIVVDNASTDDTAKIASSFPVRVVHEPRKGLLWAREAGRRNSSGDIIANMDADCLPDALWLSRGAPHFSDPGVAAVTGPYDYHDGGNMFRVAALFAQRYAYRFTNALFQHRYVKKGAVLIGGNNMLRARALQKSGGYDTSIAFYGEDTDTAKRVARQGRVVFDPSLAMKTSARRFKDEGTAAITAKYLFYFFRTILRTSPYRAGT